MSFVIKITFIELIFSLLIIYNTFVANLATSCETSIYTCFSSYFRDGF